MGMIQTQPLNTLNFTSDFVLLNNEEKSLHFNNTLIQSIVDTFLL